jgi:WASH complex subunit strumpellin
MRKFCANNIFVIAFEILSISPKSNFFRIVGFHVEQESNLFLKQKSNLYQSRTIPIPLFPSPDPNCLTFMGRLANELVNLTNPKTTIFIPARQAWFDTKTQGETQK